MRILLHVLIITFLISFENLLIAGPLQDANELSARAGKFYKSGNYSKAALLMDRSLKIYEKKLGPYHKKVAITAQNLAIVYKSLGYFGQSEKLSNQSLEIVTHIYGSNHPEVATCLSNLASLYDAVGDFNKSELLHKKSLEIREYNLNKDHVDVAHSLANLAMFYKQFGNYEEAELLIKRGIDIYKINYGEEHPNVATCINNLADIYIARGEYALAEPLLQKALSIRRKVLGLKHHEVAKSINNLGVFYFLVGNLKKSENYLLRSISLTEEVLGGDHFDIAVAKQNVALLHYSIGNYLKSIDFYEQSVVLLRKHFGDEHPNIYMVKANLALAYMLVERFVEARALVEAVGTPLLWGNYYFAVGKYKEAGVAFEESMSFHNDMGEKALYLASTVGLALVTEKEGDLLVSEEYFRKAVDDIEGQWVTLSRTARKSFLSSKIGLLNLTRLDVYEGLMRVLLKQKSNGYEKEMLQYAELVKGRGFLEDLSGRRLIVKRTKANRILEQDRKYQQLISRLRTQLNKFETVYEEKEVNKYEQIKERLAKVLDDYESFLEELKLSGSEDTGLVTVEPFSLLKLQKVIPVNTTVLEIYTAKNSIYVWIIENDDIKFKEINCSEENLIELVNNLVIPNISNRLRRPSPVITFDNLDLENQEEDSLSLNRNRKKFNQYLKVLNNLIISPLLPMLNKPNIVIIPHGVLHKIPFGALKDDHGYLMDKFSITMNPSGGVYKYLKSKKNINHGRLVAFVNPTTEYEMLHFSEIEIAKVGQYFALKKIFSQDEATETRAHVEVANTDIVHFASHGEFNDRQPLQSGLLLSKDDRNDGYLQVHEIFGLDLAEANLVTLSACETALSKVQGGDDLVGLSRAFIYAGSPSILATLWQVDDQSTALLMYNFYKNWREKGLSISAALQSAQKKVRSTKGYEHPFYWAPFVLIGDSTQ